LLRLVTRRRRPAHELRQAAFESTRCDGRQVRLQQDVFDG
jgi:hypothetical protein